MITIFNKKKYLNSKTFKNLKKINLYLYKKYLYLNTYINVKAQRIHQKNKSLQNFR